VNSARTLSGYTPPHIDYQPAKVGDLALHQQAQQLVGERGPASRVTLSPAAQAAMKAHIGGGA
jgi:hypothetical protein